VWWTSPVTNRLLLEANVQLGPNFWWGAQQKNSYDTTTIPVSDAALTVVTPNGPVTFTNLNYRSANWSGHTGFTTVAQGSVSYVTGSHSSKFGARFHENNSTFPKNFYNGSQLTYQVSGGRVDPANNIHIAGAPSTLTMFADQGSQQQQRQRIFALYAQDRWSINRLSVQGGLRYEHLADHFGEQKFGPNRFLPTQIVFAPTDGPLHLNELQPRFGASYDMFGNGKTAAKVFFGRYVTTTNTVDEWASYSPAGAGHFVTSTTRTWNDRGGLGIDGDYVPQCDLLNPALNGECGPMANPSFGKTINPLTIDPDTTSGWNKREYSWDLSPGDHAGSCPREFRWKSITSGGRGETSRRRSNRALTPADFDSFVYNVPTDPRLPGGGGYSLTFLDMKPGKFGVIDNYQTIHRQSRGRLEHVQRR
jgi:hypothetical protein